MSKAEGVSSILVRQWSCGGGWPESEECIEGAHDGSHGTRHFFPSELDVDFLNTFLLATAGTRITRMPTSWHLKSQRSKFSSDSHEATRYVNVQSRAVFYVLIHLVKQLPNSIPSSTTSIPFFSQLIHIL